MGAGGRLRGGWCSGRGAEGQGGCSMPPPSLSLLRWWPRAATQRHSLHCACSPLPAPPTPPAGMNKCCLRCVKTKFGSCGLGSDSRRYGARLHPPHYHQPVWASETSRVWNVCGLCYEESTPSPHTANSMGFSDTMGAFIAGVLLSETNYKTQVCAWKERGSAPRPTARSCGWVGGEVLVGGEVRCSDTKATRCVYRVGGQATS